MRMGQGVEWALHGCLNLALVPPSQPVPAALLAEVLDAPPAYLTKQLQALTKAEVLRSTPGPRGGFSLARDPADITYLDVVTAIEGPGPSFRCTELPATRAAADFAGGLPDAVCHRRDDVARRAGLARGAEVPHHP